MTYSEKHPFNKFSPDTAARIMEPLHESDLLMLSGNTLKDIWTESDTVVLKLESETIVLGVSEASDTPMRIPFQATLPALIQGAWLSVTCNELIDTQVITIGTSRGPVVIEARSHGGFCGILWRESPNDIPAEPPYPPPERVLLGRAAEFLESYDSPWEVLQREFYGERNQLAREIRAFLGSDRSDP